jgi:hypothetical protein
VLQELEALLKDQTNGTTVTKILVVLLSIHYVHQSSTSKDFVLIQEVTKEVLAVFGLVLKAAQNKLLIAESSSTDQRPAKIAEFMLPVQMMLRWILYQGSAEESLKQTLREYDDDLWMNLAAVLNATANAVDSSKLRELTSGNLHVGSPCYDEFEDFRAFLPLSDGKIDILSVSQDEELELRANDGTEEEVISVKLLRTLQPAREFATQMVFIFFKLFILAI